MSSSTPRVLVVGAGPSGLALALSLLRNGIAVRIIEKQPKYQVGSRGSGLQPRALELYKLLGVLPDIMAASGSPMLFHQHNAPEDDTPPKIFPLSEMVENTPSRPYNNLRMLGQHFHEGIIRSYLLKDYGCEVELGTELQSFEQKDDCVVAEIVKTTSATGSQASETATFDWLIGTDGARGVVRRQLGSTFLGETPTGVGMVIGDIHVKKGLETNIWMAWGNLASRGVVFRPYEIPNDDRCNFLIGGHEVDLQKVASSREEIIRAIREITGRQDIEFGELIFSSIWRPNIRMANKFNKGRVFVAGDAAHVHPPTGGQGMNTGVQDAVNLGWKLALVQKGLASQSILESYTLERLPVIATMLDLTKELFNVMFKPLTEDDPGAGYFRSYETRQLGVNYRGSPIVVDQRFKAANEAEAKFDPYRSGEDGKVRAGDRAPDAPGLKKQTDGTITSLFDSVFGSNYHTALIFSQPDRDAETAAIVKTLKAYPEGTVKSAVIYQSIGAGGVQSVETAADLAFLDTEGFAFKHYVVADGSDVTVVIVRPDGYIGAVVYGVEGVKTYFKGIFI